MKPIISQLATIKIADLSVPAIIGTRAHERRTPQNIIMNIEIQYRAKKAIHNDSLRSALDYEAIRNEVVAFVRRSQFQLLEHLTWEVLQMVLRKPQVRFASVRIAKPGALPDTKSVSIELSGKNIK